MRSYLGFLDSGIRDWGLDSMFGSIEGILSYVMTTQQIFLCCKNSARDGSDFRKWSVINGECVDIRNPLPT